MKKTVRAIAVLDAVRATSNESLDELIYRAVAIQQTVTQLFAAASGDSHDFESTFRAIKVDTDSLDGKSLWQQNKVAYVVEMDYSVTE